ncbi:hypothetical protein EVAR_30609_1 [Eumeta japonica]|uniref:Uncharacterized protein n=1 Tax=Eumeta variegata TaxID=151549 RepID=A0A4C1W9F8_EUMVA|nr:hypothetical protein EVAR_30609_1 [Eumeta japonica]
MTGKGRRRRGVMPNLAYLSPRCACSKGVQKGVDIHDEPCVTHASSRSSVTFAGHLLSSVLKLLPEFYLYCNAHRITHNARRSACKACFTRCAPYALQNAKTEKLL